MMNPDYLDDVLIRLAHHSSAIEGNTISLPDTVQIIENGTIPQRSGQSIREIFEILNHKEAFRYVYDRASQEEPLTVEVVRQIHRLLTDRLQHDSGEYKSQENAIKGADFHTAKVEDVPMLMQQLIDNLYYRCSVASSDEDLLASIADYHIQFERIHPFSDGNGRTGRMVMNYSLIEHQLPLVIIEKEDRPIYLDALAHQDVEGLVDLMALKMTIEKERQGRFQASDDQQIHWSEDDELK